MENFKTFLTTSKTVAEKRIPYYLNWVRRFQDTMGKGPEEPFTDEEIQRFLKGIELHHEEWQVKQAKEALDLYRYYQGQLVRGDTQNETAAVEAWKQMGEELVRILRLKHRALSTEKTYLSWVRDFYHFVKGNPPPLLEGRHVVDYLSHLAVERKLPPAPSIRPSTPCCFSTAMSSIKKSAICRRR